MLFSVCDGKNVLINSGNSVLCCTSIDYVSGVIEKISPQRGYSFRYDATKYDGWHEKEYTPCGEWENAFETGVDLPMFQRPVQQLVVEQSHESRMITKGFFKDKDPEALAGTRMYTAVLSQDGSGDGIYQIVDLGEETVADTITLHFSLKTLLNPTFSLLKKTQYGILNYIN